jgi:hypothetical protein
MWHSCEIERTHKYTHTQNTYTETRTHPLIKQTYIYTHALALNTEINSTVALAAASRDACFCEELEDFKRTEEGEDKGGEDEERECCAPLCQSSRRRAGNFCLEGIAFENLGVTHADVMTSSTVSLSLTLSVSL